MNKYLIVVDMQNDFVTGSLGTDEAKSIVSNVVEKVKNFKGKVIFTQDTHEKNYLNTQEGKILPIEHCINKTSGWDIIDPLKEIIDNKEYSVYTKGSFGSIELAEYIKNKYNSNEIDSVELIGLCTDICVISNALIIKALSPEIPIYLDSSCCAGVTPDKHEAALKTMESCQIIVK